MIRSIPSGGAFGTIQPKMQSDLRLKGLSHFDEDAVSFTRQAYIDAPRTKNGEKRNLIHNGLFRIKTKKELFSPNTADEKVPSLFYYFRPSLNVTDPFV